MKLTQEEARDIVNEDAEGWLEKSCEITGTRRWSVNHTGVYEHIESSKFYELSFSRPSTEILDEEPFEYEDPNPIEVEEKEVTVKKWVAVKK